MKTIDEIYSELKSSFETETGAVLNDGGDMALRFRAFAAQLASLQAQADYVERQCFPQTASGSALDTHALQRGLVRMPAAKAEGVIRFSLDCAVQSDVPVPEGTRCITADGIEFEVTEDGGVSAGSTYCDVPARAVLAGKKGNIPENTALFMELAPAGISACTNPEAFSGGYDGEDDEGLRARVLDSFTNAPNSGNVSYYRNLALSVDGVAAVSVQPRHRGRGTVDITVAGENGTPDAAVLTQVSRNMNGRREICVDVYVNSPTLQSVNVDVEVEVNEDCDSDAVLQNVESAIRAFFTGRLLGKAVKRAELGNIIFGVEGVENYTVNAPAADVAASPQILPTLGTLSVSEV